MSGIKPKATSLKNFSIIIMVLIILLGGAGLYYAQNYLTEKANFIIKESIDQSTGSDQSAKLISVLNANKTYVDKASAMTTTDSNYRFQITKDLNLYANSTGVSIKSIETNVNYNENSPLEFSTLPTKFVKVTFNNPVAYSGFEKFLRGLETNLPKMQPMNLEIEGNVGSFDAVNIKPIFIKIYMDNN